MNRIFYKLIIILAYSTIFVNKAYPCSPFAIPTLNSQTINGSNLELQWTSCTGWSCNYEVNLELRCNSEPFTGVFNYTSPMISKPTPTCLPFPLMIIDISSLCPGQTYKFRAKECWISSSSCSGLTTTFTFTIPGSPGLSVTASASPTSICDPGCSSLSAIVTNPCGNLTYTWDNGLGNGQNQNVCPVVTTTYNVTITECGTVMATASVTVNVDLPPIAGIASISPINICSGATTNLTLTGYNGNIQWQQSATSGGPWSNIVGATSASYTTGPLTNVTYFIAEVFNGCGLVTSNEIMVTIDPVPSAVFGFIPKCQYDSISFTDGSTISSGSVISWIWDFGDGNSSNLQNPSHQYASDGTYNVQLVAISNIGCRDSITQAVTVHPVPNAVITTGNVCLYDNAVFTDASTINTGSITSWNWDFGDGNTSTTQNPVHPYSIDGTYNVSLIVTSNNSCVDTVVQSLIIYPVPAAGFTTGNVCLYDAALFTDITTINAPDNIATWQWDFGDGNTSTSQNTANLYGADGSYNVTLLVTSNNGCLDSIVQPLVIHPVPIADFIAPSVCFGNATQFIDLSIVPIGSITSWNWNFGDSNTSTQQNPSHIFSAAGLYNVTLFVATDSGCVDSITKVIVVHYVPLANFNSTNVCLNDTMVFNNTSLISFGSIVAWQWDFGDGPPAGTSTLQNPTYVFSPPDSFIVTLTVTSDSGCTSIVGYPVEVYPLPVAGFTTANVCLYDDAVFIDVSTISIGSVTSWQWDFGDGNTSTSQNTVNLYGTDGAYNVTLIVASNNGCSDTIVQSIDIYPIPVAVFNTNNVCLYDPAVFVEASTINIGNIVSWNWDFGDGNTSTTQSPTYLYTTDGTYYVSLFVTTNNSCVDTVVDTLIIYPEPSAGFTTGPICLYDAAMFTDVTTINPPDNVVSWQWIFGDGIGTSIIQNPSYNYGSDGLYNVQLTVTSNNNCIDNTALTIEIYPLPVADFTSDTLIGCEPLCVNFTDQTAITGGGGTISFWDWDFGDGSTSNEQNPENCYMAIDVNTARISTVTLIATSSNGCLDTLPKVDMITTWPNPIAEFTATPQPTTFMNPVIYFTDQSQGDTITWAWDFGDPASDETDFTQNPVHEYSDTGFYVVEQIIVNQFSCSDTFYRTVIILPDYIFHVPSAFTPDNKDGINDEFFPKGIGIDEKNFEMYIYDRWGDKIYETNDINKPWDGRANNGRQIAQQDIYIWMIFIKDVLGKRHRYIGRVTLIR